MAATTAPVQPGGVTDAIDCPCGTGRAYASCCGRFHRGEAEASTAELLMRSRFSAFAVGDVAYLARSWAAATRPDSIELVPGRRWTRLEVLATDAGGMLAADGIVEFRAHHATGERTGTHHEVSRFVREDGRWVYLGAAP